MYIKNISIKNFRSFNNLEINDFKNINIFVGKNNCGKTSILESLFLLVGMSNPSLNVTINNLRDLIHTELDDFRFIFKDLSYNNTITLKSDFYNSDRRELIIKPNYMLSKDDNKFIGEDIQKNIIPELGTNDINIKKLDNKLKGNIDLDSISDIDKMNGLDLQFKLNEKEYDGKTIYNKGLIVPVADRGYRDDYNAKILSKNNFVDIKKLGDVIINMKEDVIIDYLKLIDVNISGISVIGQMIYFKIKGIEKLVPINIMGDGIVKILNILIHVISLPNEKYKILLIDEIENGLHFSIISILWKMLIKFSEVSKLQIFLTSHSYDILKYLQSYKDGDGDTSFKENCVCYSIRKSDDNKKEFAYRYDFDSFSLAIDEGNEIR